MKQVQRTLKGFIYAWILIALALSVHTVLVLAEGTEETDTDWTETGVITEAATLDRDLEISFGTLYIFDELNLNGHTLTVNGNVDLQSDLYLDGGKLIATGNFNHGNADGHGELFFHKGELDIWGNYTLSNPAPNGHGALVMKDDEDIMRVGGDFTTSSGSGYNVFDAGRLYLGGNFLQAGNGSFKAGGTHKVIVDGKGDQVIRFEADASGVYSNYFNELAAAEDYRGEIYISNTLNFKKLGSDISVICNEPQAEGNAEDAASEETASEETASEETASEEASHCYINKHGTDCDLNGKTLHIEGDIGFAYGLDLNGGTLDIAGSLYESDAVGSFLLRPTLTINKGTLKVTGDYNLSGNSTLIMGNEEDRIYIGRNFTTTSSSGYNNFNAGTIYLGGDFTQEGDNSQLAPDQSEASPSTHKVLLNGTGKQTIRFEAAGYSNSNYFNEIGVVEGYEGEVHISRSLNFRKLVTDMTIISDTPAGADIEEDAQYAFINKSGAATCDINGHKLHIIGNVGFLNKLDINGGSMEIDGDFYEAYFQTYGVPGMKFNKGTLQVNGNFNLINNAYMLMVDPEDTLRVTGDFTTSTVSGYNELKAGTIYVGGDFTKTGTTSIRFGEGCDIIFNGKEFQTISIDKGDPVYSYFYNVGLTKNKETGYQFPEQEFMLGEFFCAEHSGGTATCRDRAVCVVFGEEYGELDPDNHAGGTEIRNAKDATYTETGYTGDTYCKGCGTRLADGEEIPMMPKLDISKADITGITGAVYTGSPIQQAALSVKYGETVLQAGTDYTVAYENNTAVGTAKVVITGIGIYTGTATQTFEITAPEAPKQESAGTTLTDTASNATVDVTNPGTIVDGKVTGAEVSYAKPAEAAATVTIPDTVKVGDVEYAVTSVKKDAFKGDKTITSVTVGGNVKTIDSGAFSNCKNLKTVKIGNNVETIGNNAFAGNGKLTGVTMGSNVATVGDKAFYKCSSLKKVTLPSSVTKIGRDAFSGCTKMTSATIGKNVKSIGANAFSGSKKLKTVTIKSPKVPTIGKNAFKGLPKNATIKVPKKSYNDYKKKLTSKTGFQKTMKLKKV